MYVLDIAKLPRSALPGIQHTTLASSENGLKHLSIWRQTIEGGQATPPHRHNCEEVVVIESGRGELHIAGSVYPFGANTTLVIPPNVDHQIINVGAEPMNLTAAFSTSPVAAVFPDGQPIPLPWKS
jgi:mannose-6-phosphate isomerase-like protein (cupin superfamily)